MSANSYSKLINQPTYDTTSTYKGMPISEHTRTVRNRIRASLDNFTTFS